MKAAHMRQADTLGDGRTFRVLNIVDDFSREAIATEMGKSIPGSRVVRALERMARQRGPPSTIVVDKGPEFTSRVLDQWACEHGVELHFIPLLSDRGGHVGFHDRMDHVPWYDRCIGNFYDRSSS